MDLQLHGKRCVVLGGSRGIGRAIALGLATEGADVAVTTADGAATTGEALEDETSAPTSATAPPSSPKVHEATMRLQAAAQERLLPDLAPQPWTLSRRKTKARRMSR